MKKSCFWVVALVTLLAAVPALADVTVTAVVTKDKDVVVDENIAIYKDVNVIVDLERLLGKAAESNTTVNQRNTGDAACENCAEKRDIIGGAVNANTGIANVNQASGNMNNQGNVVSVAVDPTNGELPLDPQAGLAQAQTAAQQINEGNRINSILILFRDTLIRGSVQGNRGIVGVNQSAGNINNQLNAATLGISLDGVIALAEADLGQANFGFGDSVDLNGTATITEFATNKTAIIDGSILGNRGIVGVNQTSGNLANQANVANLAVSIR